jgi:hypothetical protein
MGENAPASPLGGAESAGSVERRSEAPPDHHRSDVVHRSPDDQEPDELDELDELDEEDARP